MKNRSGKAGSESDATSQPNTASENTLFEELLDGALGDEEIKRSVLPIRDDALEDPIAAIRADVIGERSRLLDETHAHKEAWEVASLRYEEANAALRTVRLLNRVGFTVAVAVALAVAVSVARALLALPVPWLDLSTIDPVLASSAVATAVYIWLTTKLAHTGMKLRVRLGDWLSERDSQASATERS